MANENNGANVNNDGNDNDDENDVDVDDGNDNKKDECDLTVEERARRLYRGVALAPMVRASTTPLRVLALKYGADVCYTEELVDRSVTETIRTVNTTTTSSADGTTTTKTIDFIKDTSGLSKRVKRRLEREGGPPLFLRIDPSIERGKLIGQLGTGQPELALKAALHLSKDVDAIDVNMGCPKKFSVGGGMGSALLRDPSRAANILRTLRENLSVPVSCKIRLLKDTQETLTHCQTMIDKGGVNAIAIHGRRVGHESTVKADWETLANVVTILRQRHPLLPILVNGDFYTRDEWNEFMTQTGASGVLLARPALHNTSIFRKPTTTTNTTVVEKLYGYNSPLLLDKTTVIRDYLRECVKYNTHYKNAKYVVAEMMNNRRAPVERFPFLVQEYPGGQTISKVCSCHTTESLCQLWNVQTTGMVVNHNKAPLAAAAPAGEHRYDDSYILRQQELPTPSNNSHPHKRLKVETTTTTTTATSSS